MENYSKIHSYISDRTPDQTDNTSIMNDTALSSLDKNAFEPLIPKDVKEEPSIFEVFKSKEYTETIRSIINSIENYSKEIDGYDDYPYFRIQNTCKFIPKLDTASEILSEKQLKELHAHMHYYHQYKNLKLLYSSSKHGISLRSFYQLSEGAKNTILIIKDDNQNVFGAYASDEYRISHTFYGTGETFLFTFYKTDRIHVFHPTGLNDYYIYSDDKQICYGCSDNYFSLCLEKEFLCGYSKYTQTFKNPNLSTSDNFFISKLELWTFQDSSDI
jgi:hypothetical protein